jgi:hypothetical protein
VRSLSVSAIWRQLTCPISSRAACIRWDRSLPKASCPNCGGFCQVRTLQWSCGRVGCRQSRAVAVPASRRALISRMGGWPKSLLYSRLNCLHFHADLEGGTGGIQTVIEHALSSYMQSKLLLVLNSQPHAFFFVPQFFPCSHGADHPFSGTIEDDKDSGRGLFFGCGYISGGGDYGEVPGGDELTGDDFDLVATGLALTGREPARRRFPASGLSDLDRRPGFLQQRRTWRVISFCPVFVKTVPRAVSVESGVPRLLASRAP